MSGTFTASLTATEGAGISGISGVGTVMSGTVTAGLDTFTKGAAASGTFTAGAAMSGTFTVSLTATEGAGISGTSGVGTAMSGTETSVVATFKSNGRSLSAFALRGASDMATGNATAAAILRTFSMMSAR